MICLTSCSTNNTASVSAQQKEPEKETEIIKEVDSDPKKQEEDKTENIALEWEEITEDGVEEDILFENMNADTMEYVAAELQTLVEVISPIFLL